MDEIEEDLLKLLEKVRLFRAAESKKQVLLVDDDPILHKIFAKYFINKGFQVTIATDGGDAIEKFKNEKYDIIFTDIEIPIKNGIELTREIRDYEKTNKRARTPIVGLTGFQMKRYEISSMEAGMDRFLNKDGNLGKMFTIATELLPTLSSTN